MSLFFWKKNKVIDIFASTMANELYSLVQPQAAANFFNTAANDKDSKKTKKKIESKINDIIKQVDQFRVTNSLGVYGKARLHLKFAERLKELGYDEDIAKKINEHVMLKTP